MIYLPGILPALDQKLQVLKVHRNQGNHGHQPDQANVRSEQMNLKVYLLSITYRCIYKTGLDVSFCIIVV